MIVNNKYFAWPSIHR